MKYSVYAEITYEEFCRKENSEFKDKLFISLYGTLMEVEEDYYKQFYREKRREKYMQERSAAKGDIHYNALDTNDFNGEDILISAEVDICEQVTDKLMAEYIRNLTSLLPSEEKELSGKQLKIVEEYPPYPEWVTEELREKYDKATGKGTLFDWLNV